MMKTYTAAWIVPITSPPLAGGTITVDNDRIISVDSHGRHTADIDLGDVAILPGLVNAHTHLDLSGARGLMPPTPDFPSWLKQIRAYRASRTIDEVAMDIADGMGEIAESTVLVGDIRAIQPSMVEPVPNVHCEVFHEVIALSQERFAARLAEIPPDVRLSPHASYSVRHDRLLPLLANGNPIHLGEWPDELDPHGPIAEWIRYVGVWRDDAWTMTVEEIARHATLIIHGNYLDPSWLQPDQHVVYCPRTHAAFGHSRHLVKEFLDCGINVALGTDSLASNPDLSMWNEARWLWQHRPDLGEDTILKMATINGARALGMDRHYGSLEPGKVAALMTVPNGKHLLESKSVTIFHKPGASATGQSFPVADAPDS